MQTDNSSGLSTDIINKEHFRKTFKRVLQLFHQQEPSVAIHEGLVEMKKFFEVDRAFIGHFDEDNSLLSFMYEVCTEGVYGISDILNNDFKETVFTEGSKYAWWINNIRSGNDTVISNVHEAPEEYRPLVEVMIGNKVKSVLTTPIYGDKKITGFLGLEYTHEFHDWREVDLENAHFFADLFSIVIEKDLVQKTVENYTQAVLRSDTIFEKIFETLPVGIELYDEKGYLVKVNPYDLEILGTTEEDVLGVNLFENPHIPESALEKIRNGQEATFENDYDYTVIKETSYFKSVREKEVMRLLGKYIPLKDDSGKVFAYLSLVHNDVSYYQNKEELQESLAKLKLSIDTGKSFLWDYDIPENKITVDYNFLEMKNIPWAGYIDYYTNTKEGHMKYIHEEDREMVEEGIEKLLRGEIPFFTAKYRQTLENEECWFSTNFRTYKYDESGKPVKIICLTTDITKQRQDEIELFKAKETNRVKKAFIENISHELRTPLNIIVGFSNLLLENSNTVENQYFIKLIQENNDLLLNLVNKMLTFTTIEKGDMRYEIETVDVKEICKEVFLLKFYNKENENQFLFDENLPSLFVKTDKERIIQVLYLLLDNANKYTKNGTIHLFYYQINTKEVRVEVKDTGIGLTAEEIGSIYIQFYKIDNYRPGLGLGLPISKRMIEDLGGVCGVDSEKGKGSNFWFNLPLA